MTRIKPLNLESPPGESRENLKYANELMGIISLFGFLNRWNDTVATELEDVPFNFAKQAYDASIWSPGKHRKE